MKIKCIHLFFFCFLATTICYTAENEGIIDKKENAALENKANNNIRKKPNNFFQKAKKKLIPPIQDKIWFLGIRKSIWLGMLSMPIAALLAAFIAYHPSRIKKMGVKPENRDVPKALILLGVGGAVVCSLISADKTGTMAFALFGFGSFIRFRTPVKNPKETVVIFLCAMIGCFCGLYQFHLAVAATIFVWILIWFLERGVGSELERITVVLRGLGTDSQIALKVYKENLETANIKVVSSKISLRKGNITILLNKKINQTVDDLEEILFSGTNFQRPKSVEWIRE